MRNPDTLSQVKSGFRLVGLIFLFIGIAGLFVGGIAYAFFPTGHSPVLGWVFIAISTAVMIALMNRWVKVLPGLLGLAVLNGVISILSGHVLANPTEPIPRLQAFYLTLFFAASSVLSGTFKARHLHLVDRAAVMVFVFSFAWLLASQSTRAGGDAALNLRDVVTMGIGLGCLLAAWLYDHFRHRRGHGSRSASHVTAL